VDARARARRSNSRVVAGTDRDGCTPRFASVVSLGAWKDEPAGGTPSHVARPGWDQSTSVLLTVASVASSFSFLQTDNAM
jgi:hypothetical protein